LEGKGRSAVTTDDIDIAKQFDIRCRVGNPQTDSDRYMKTTNLKLKRG
jgi:hypothetical protein